MNKTTGKKILKGIGFWIAAIVAFTFFLVAVFSIPRAWLQEHVDRSLEMIQEEGEYPTPFFHIFACKMDNVADEILIRIAEQPDQNEAMASLVVGDHSKDVYSEDWDATALEKAMVGGYARYWHGYEVVLRPLLMVTDLAGVRYFNMMVFFLLLFTCLLQIREKLGVKTAVAFLVSVLMVYGFAVPMCMEFVSVFWILFGAVSVLLAYYDRWREHPERVAYFFVLIGSLTNFMDFLTAPILTLGIPLLFYCVLEARRGTGFRRMMVRSILFSAIWGISYAMTWISKWAFASLLLQKNVMADALQSMLFRTGGGESEAIPRGLMLMNNIGKLFGSDANSMIFKVCVLMAAAMGVYFLLRHKPWKKIAKNGVFLWIALYPILWYLVLSNHSYIHPYFTYRALIVSLMGA
ncbi:MAG: hypothetical protein HFK02_05440, partial [Clostridia bacterium]|nr:hypothetical protein [Clostridia bacterium]